MDLGFRGRTVLLTGAAGGIGRATAAVMAANGASVIGVDLDEGRLKEAFAPLPSAHGASHWVIAADLSAREGAEAAAREAHARAGVVDVLLSCAGVLPAWSDQEPADRQWAYTMAVNFEAFRWAAEALLPGMRARRSGAIVAVASDLAFKVAGPAAYGVSKAALVRYLKQLAAEEGPRGIRVNAVAPGPVDTPMWGGVVSDIAERDGVTPAEAEQAELAGRFTSLGRGVLQPAQVARAVAFLASAWASGVNGAVLDLGGTNDHL
jgi:3-oxoacyl-[acyl-carrier protein] reductase